MQAQKEFELSYLTPHRKLVNKSQCMHNVYNMNARSSSYRTCEPDIMIVVIVARSLSGAHLWCHVSSPGNHSLRLRLG